MKECIKINIVNRASKEQELIFEYDKIGEIITFYLDNALIGFGSLDDLILLSNRISDIWGIDNDKRIKS